MAMVGGANLGDKNTCAGTSTENVGGGLYMKGGVYVLRYFIR